MVRWSLLLLALLPGLPGLTILAAGLITDPHWQARDQSPSGEMRYTEEWERTRGLYLAGGAVLLFGTLGMGAVAWKIARPGVPYDQEPVEDLNEPVSGDPQKP